jgi:hypothetical protein
LYPARRNPLCLQPLGTFCAGNEPPLDLLSRFAAAFFALKAVILPQVPVTGVTARINSYTGDRQLLTRDLLALLAHRRPASACCVVGLTMDDLYPDPAWKQLGRPFGARTPTDELSFSGRGGEPGVGEAFVDVMLDSAECSAEPSRRCDA